MDLALAKFVEAQAAAAGRLDAAQYGMLDAGVPRAKEALLGPNPPAELPGHGHGPRPRRSSAARCTRSSRPDDVRQAIFDGFFPLVAASTPSRRAAPAPACTRWACPTSATRPSRATSPRSCSTARLERRRRLGAGRDPVQRRRLPAGGRCASALVDVMRPWYDRRAAVAAARADQPVARPGGGLGRGLLRLAAAHRRQAHRRRHPAVLLRRHRDRHARGAAFTPDSITGRSASCRSGWRRAQEVDLPKPELELALGQPVLFPLYTSTVRGDDKPGDVLRLAAGLSCCNCRRCTRSCAAASGAGRSTCRSRWRPRRTEIGTLELYCVAEGRRQPLAAGVQRPRRASSDAGDEERGGRGAGRR